MCWGVGLQRNSRFCGRWAAILHPGVGADIASSAELDGDGILELRVPFKVAPLPCVCLAASLRARIGYCAR